MTTDHIPFTRGVPPAEVLPLRELVKITEEVLATTPKTAFQYSPIGRHLGDPDLRSEIAHRHETDPDTVFVGNGSLQVLDLLAGLLIRRERRVYVESPTYDRAIRIFQRHGGQVIGVPMDRDGVDVTLLRALVSEQAPALFYTIPDFQNPSGVCTSAEKRKALVELAEEFCFPIVQDTPYRPLRFRGTDAPSVAVAGDTQVITIGSLSKVLSPGLRVGYAVGTESLVASLAGLAEDTYLTASPLCQSIAARCFADGVVEDSIASIVRFLTPRHDAAVRAVTDAFGDGLIAVPDGGYFLSVLTPSSVDAGEVQTLARNAGVLLTPGSAFFVDERSLRGKLFLRLPFQALTEDEFATGVWRLASVLRER